jgi:folate-binding protein YgfZ
MLQGTYDSSIPDGSNVDFAAFDPRCERLGLRLYSRRTNLDAIFDSQDVTEVSKLKYDALRYAMMIPEADECKGAIPAKMNFDILGSIDLNKGCFLGQELTARSYYTGVVRKRPYFMVAHPPGFPVNPAAENIGLSLFDENFTADLKGKVIKDKDGRNVLTIIGIL